MATKDHEREREREGQKGGGDREREGDRYGGVQYCMSSFIQVLYKQSSVCVCVCVCLSYHVTAAAVFLEHAVHHMHHSLKTFNLYLHLY